VSYRIRDQRFTLVLIASVAGSPVQKCDSKDEADTKGDR
jgi:hypothetical protein